MLKDLKSLRIEAHNPFHFRGFSFRTFSTDTTKKNEYKSYLLEPAQRVSPDVGAGISFFQGTQIHTGQVLYIAHRYLLSLI